MKPFTSGVRFRSGSFTTNWRAEEGTVLSVGGGVVVGFVGFVGIVAGFSSFASAAEAATLSSSSCSFLAA